MRIGTWNIGGAYLDAQTKDLRYVVDSLVQENLDIICLQEVHMGCKENQAKEIAENAGFEHLAYRTLSESHVEEGAMFALAILSKYPIISSTLHPVRNPNLSFTWKGKQAYSHDKAILEISIDVDGERVHVFCAHMLPFHSFKRNILEEEFADIRDAMEQLFLAVNAPVIIGGDLHHPKREELFPKLFENGFSDSFVDIVTTPNGKVRDTLFASKEFTLNTARVVEGKIDHYLCVIDVSI